MDANKKNHITGYIKINKFYSLIKERFNFILKKRVIKSNFSYTIIICIYFIKIFIEKMNLVQNIYLTNLERNLNLQLYLEKKKICFLLFGKWFKSYFI